jgi:hypothetical protein
MNAGQSSWPPGPMLAHAVIAAGSGNACDGSDYRRAKRKPQGQKGPFEIFTGQRRSTARVRKTFFGPRPCCFLFILFFLADQDGEQQQKLWDLPSQRVC